MRMKRISIMGKLMRVRRMTKKVKIVERMNNIVNRVERMS
jgi:hypothetical protein